MAYTKENLLRRILDIQQTFRENYRQGMIIEHVFDEHVYPKYKISRATFYKYLKRDAATELREELGKINAKKKRLEQLEMKF